MCVRVCGGGCGFGCVSVCVRVCVFVCVCAGMDETTYTHGELGPILRGESHTAMHTHAHTYTRNVHYIELV